MQSSPGVQHDKVRMLSWFPILSMAFNACVLGGVDPSSQGPMHVKQFCLLLARIDVSMAVSYRRLLVT